MRFPDNLVCVTSKGSNQPAHTRRLIRAFAGRLNILTVKLLTEPQLRFLSLKEAAQTRLNLHLSRYHIVGNHVSRLIFPFVSSREKLKMQTWKTE